MAKTDEISRLKKLLFKDYFNIPNGAFEILKEDILKLLRSYFEIKDDTVNLSIDIDPDGNFLISMNAKATHLKEMKILN